MYMAEKKTVNTDVTQANITSLDQIIGQQSVVRILKFYKKAYDNLKSIHGDSKVSSGPFMFTGSPGLAMASGIP